MPCSASANSALRCFLTRVEATRKAGLRARNVRYSTIETSRNLLRINSSTLRNQPPRTSRISTLQPLQVSGLHAAPPPAKDPRRRKEPSHRDGTGSMTGDNSTIRIHEHSRRVAQKATITETLSSTRDYTKSEGFLKPPPLLNNETSLDQDWLKENLKGPGPGQRGDAISRRPENPVREEYSGSSKLLGFSRKARLRDDSRTVEGDKGAKRSTRSTKASAESKNGTRTQDRKDQHVSWQRQKSALSEKFGPTGWLPRKRLSPDTLEGIRALHSQYPDKFTTPVLADQFKVSPEAIRRILKSKWQPNDEEEERRRRRWEKRGENIWSQMVEVGIKPPKKWRDMGVGKSRERRPARIEQLKSPTMPANRHETYFSVPLADRIF